ncbi:MAG: hypothetical protein EOP07_01920 [Proteobacteria bacterium]|nr:MAG: hypothetical protein EOP07_01920 [Pseudomonadota bacterium]
MKLSKLSSAWIVAIAIASGSTAMAAGAEGSQTLDLAGIKAKCAELLQNEQLKPFKAVVSCKQVVTQWRPAAAQADALQVANFKEVGATFTLKGYEVPFKSEVLDLAPTPASCSTLEQVRLTVPAVDIELACDALESVQNITDICQPAIAARVDADPSIQIEELTGETFNSCNGK